MKRMTEEEMRLSIAEWMGWKWYRLPTEWKGGKHYRCLFIPSVLAMHGGLPKGFTPADMTEPVCNPQYMEKEGMVPRYTTDLNAVHEAEEKLERDHEELCESYLEQLPNGDDWQFACAAAPQRCEALCRVLFPERWET